MWQCSLHFANSVHWTVRSSGVEKEGSCPTACAAAPMLVRCRRSFRDWSVYLEKDRDGSVLVEH